MCACVLFWNVYHHEAQCSAVQRSILCYNVGRTLVFAEIFNVDALCKYPSRYQYSHGA